MRPQPIPGPSTHSDAWYAMRIFDPDRAEHPVVFGASEAALAMNLGYGAGPLDLFMQKLLLKPPFEGNAATEFGTLLEPVVLTMYERNRKVQLLRNQPMFFHPTHSFMAATPDALVVPESGPIVEAVDAKTSTYRMVDKTGEDEDKYGVEGTDQVPIHVLLQGVAQCEVLGLDRVDFPVLIDRSIRIYHVERSDEWAAAIISAERELAERIMNNDPPPPHWTHPETSKLLNRLYGYSPGKVTQLDEHALNLHLEDLLLADEIKERVKRRTEIKNRLLVAIGDAESGVLPAGTKELHRTLVAESLWTEKDVLDAQEKIGQVKRKGHERLTARKVK